MHCRFLGLLHLEVFHQRLEQEHGASVITTTPTVPYELHALDGTVTSVSSPAQVRSSAQYQSFRLAM